jgi:hypothetical protein
MEEDCGGGEGLSWAVEPRRERERERERGREKPVYVWNSFQLVFGNSSYSETNHGNRLGVPFQQSIFGPETHRQKLVSRRIVIVESRIVGPKFRPFSTHSLT